MTAETETDGRLNEWPSFNNHHPMIRCTAVDMPLEKDNNSRSPQLSEDSAIRMRRHSLFC
jgi:hypothetical protein